MGQATLLAVVASFLIGGVVVFNANRSADSADERVWEHQYHVISRDAATTGMAVAMRDLTNAFEMNTTWNGGLATSLSKSNVVYDGGTYSVTASSMADAVGTSACPLLTNAEYENAMIGADGSRLVPQGEVIQVTVTGNVEGDVGNDTDQSHQLRACYIRADYSLFSPPAFNYGFVSDLDFDFNGGPTIQALVDGEGHVHSNGHMELGPKVEIDGHATYSGGESISKNAVVASHGTGPGIPLTTFDADEFAVDNSVSSAACAAAPENCLYYAGFTANSNLTIQPPTSDVGHRESDPFIWYIDGDFTISGNYHIKVPQYTQIVVKGNITVTGGGAVTVTGQTAKQHCGCSKPDAAQSKAWVVSQLFDGVHSPLAWYGTGDVDISGSPGLVGNFYVNGDVTLDGGGTGNNTAGSFASADGNITANGGGTGNNFWFLEVADENVTEGVKLPGKQIVRLALAEWTDPVLDN